MINVAVIGAAGYTGAELVRWLLAHPKFNLSAITSNEYAGQSLASVYPSFTGVTNAKFISHASVINSAAGINLAFLAVPHTKAMAIAPLLLESGCSVVDLSADFRLKDASTYEKWYGVAHSAPFLLPLAVYGLPEVNRNDLYNLASVYAQKGRGALVANPGCYPTAATLAVLPALAAGLVGNGTIVIDAISGVSGSGAGLAPGTRFCSAAEDVSAYSATTHRHTPEIAQTFARLAGRNVPIVFTPHLAPLKRGMVATATVPLAQNVSANDVGIAYQAAYKDETFVSLLPPGQMPHAAAVRGTNYAQVGIAYDAATHSLVASCAIDNLGKGASSQAIQNANLLFGLAEDEGLRAVGFAV
ncbi:MAG: N-acetyl-gamma-glutamyl-phosphate reductase [Coriobacteriales bacterium]|jgi:N-acetyl-gamma-glutamyl-phosphate reductase|nr:N-acetyl-gamma-glutamyl-phosphate reductase [Coriobacteriales bacterium]